MKSIVLALLFAISVAPALWAQDPGAAQDAIAERQKVLKAADQLDLLTQQNSQITQQNAQLVQQINALQDRIQKLESANGEFKSQLAQQQKDWAAEKEKLLKEVSKIVASGGGKSSKPAATENGTVPAATATATPNKPEQGYEYVVQQGQSLWAIADAYQKNGVNVTVDDIRKANNLGKDATLKVGQKLFIPKK
ncbi:MAG: LysM peptidoglycan-binding domain-containing protein [Verrucomicrobiales bacterium]|jgi:LysM repeat protein|nr:LysM peptidoglycan-binding domain-containing protein [Verrucomicrobiales bacterium]